MNRMLKGLILSGCLLGLCSGAAPQPARAQRSSPVQFKPGSYGTMVRGTIRGREYIDYKLTATKGQTMFAELTVRSTNGNGTAYFNILPPGSKGEAIYVGQNDTDSSARVKLPASGTYTIRVYLMGNDKDTGKSVNFNLDLSIQ
jgi:subtilisin family serine protease